LLNRINYQYNMRQLVLVFSFALCAVPNMPAQNIRWTGAVEVGSGIGFQSNNTFDWGYHNIGVLAEYRIRPILSFEVALRYYAIDGQGVGFGYNNLNLRLIQQCTGAGLTVGSRINLRVGPASDISVAPRIGLMMHRIVQPIYVGAELRQTRYYHPVFTPGFEISGRWTKWLSTRTALEMGIHFVGSPNISGSMRVAREEGQPLPDLNFFPGDDTQGEFEGIAREAGYHNALMTTLGIRTKLGNTLTTSKAPDKEADAAQWGLIVGGQMMIPDIPARERSTGIHVGLFISQRLTTGIHVQLESQVKYHPVRIPLVTFEDYVTTPIAFGYSYKPVQLATMAMLEFPVLVKIQPGNKHAWLLGIRPSVNMIRIEDQMGGSSSSGAVDLADFENIDYRQAVRRGDIGISAGYEYALTNHLRLSLRYTQGLYDMTHDNFFKSTSTYTNSDLQASVRLSF
jgi:Outer membrane protein beta-barrel domain